MSMFAGIDWGGIRHQLAAVDDAGKEVFNEGFGHDASGLARSLAAVDGFDLVGIAIERSEELLVEQLQASGHRIYGVSPRVSAGARERHPLKAGHRPARGRGL